MDTLSEYVVSFHYVVKDKMETLEYLLYRARPYGIQHRWRDINQHWRVLIKYIIAGIWVNIKVLIFGRGPDLDQCQGFDMGQIRVWV